MWTQQEAIDLCVKVEAVCPQFHFHVGLTGGLLYKQGERKDADLLFYRVRQESVDYAGLAAALEDIGLTFVADHGFVKKALYNGKPVDCLFPDEADNGEYGEASN